MAIPRTRGMARRCKRKPEEDLLKNSKPPAKICKRSSPPKINVASKQEDDDDGGDKYPKKTSKPPSATKLAQPTDSHVADWPSLPDDFLILITERLCFEDYVSLTAACNPWRSILSTRPPTPCGRRPWFMLDFRSLTKTFWFVTLHGDYHSVHLPEPSSICGSSQGWLMVSTPRSRKFFRYRLLNPFSMAQIKLPSVPPFPITSMVLSSLPTSEACTIMAIGDCRQVAFTSMDSPTWRCVPLQWSRNIEDAVFFQGRFYFITSKGKLGFFERYGGGSTRWKTSWLALRSVRKPPGSRVKRYLAVGPDNDKLLMVRRVFGRGNKDDRTCSGELYEIRWDIMEWKATNFLTDSALFVSEFSSAAFIGQECQRSHACNFLAMAGKIGGAMNKSTRI